MTDFVTMVIVGATSLAALGYIANWLVFVPSDKFPTLRSFDDKDLELPIRALSPSAA